MPSPPQPPDRTHHRRSFLATAGLAGASLAPAALRPAAAQPAVPPQPDASSRNGTRALVTAEDGPLALAIAVALGKSREVRLTARGELPGAAGLVRCALEHDAATAAAAADCAAIVVVPPPTARPEPERIEYLTRCLYNLLRAAAEGGAKQVVYLSTLAMMAAYGERLAVNEDFRPRPSSPHGGLAEYLGECVCREFAREGKLAATVLRLGRVFRAGEDAAARDSADLEWSDAVEAVRLAVEARRPGGNLPAWTVLHVAAPTPHARFSPAKAQKLLGWQPRFRG
jgi:nucleoside-diphosphate-sugar epimerase